MISNRMPLLLVLVLLLGTAGASAQGKSEDVPKGYRGVLVPISLLQAQATRVGDHVDVIVAYNYPLVGKAEGISQSSVVVPAAVTILQNAKVIKVISDKDSSSAALQLLLNQNEAQYLAWGLAWGKGVYISIRAPGDEEIHPLEISTPNKFYK